MSRIKLNLARRERRKRKFTLEKIKAKFILRDTVAVKSVVGVVVVIVVGRSRSNNSSRSNINMNSRRNNDNISDDNEDNDKKYLNINCL